MLGTPGQNGSLFCVGLRKLGGVSEYIPLSYPWVHPSVIHGYRGTRENDPSGKGF